MAEVQIKQKIELHPLLDEFFHGWEIVEVEVTDAEIILKKPDYVEHLYEIGNVVQKTHGTIKIKDKEIIKRIAEAIEKGLVNGLMIDPDSSGLIERNVILNGVKNLNSSKRIPPYQRG